MKHTVSFLQTFCTFLLCGGLMLACSKTDTAPDEPGNPNPNLPGIPDPKDSVVATADTIANHLLFFGAVKKSGPIPKGPSGSSLKISFKDTLYLMDELKRPIKFLHVDTLQNVAGVYVQVHYTGGSATFYYDVPELPDMADNDSVSVILIGVNPSGLINESGVPPAGRPFAFEITITPYNEAGQLLAEVRRPVKISPPNSNPSGSGGTCGLVLPPGDFWQWDLSLIEVLGGSGQLAFYNDPKKVWGAGGQFITGCCINGVSSYNQVLNCESDPTKARRKLFPTFFQHQESLVKFFEDGTYSQFSKQTHANPDPGESNFCSAATGVVNVRTTNVTEEGTWRATKGAPYKGDSLQLQLIQTASTGVGLVSPGGFIHQLDCGTLALVSPDREGGNRDLVSFYFRVNTGEDGWYELL